MLSRGFAMDKNMSSKIKEVKDIAATKEQAQRSKFLFILQSFSEIKFVNEI